MMNTQLLVLVAGLTFLGASGTGAAAPVGRTAAEPVTTAAAVRAIPSFSQPAMSPDGSQIAFVANSAIWAVPSAGGAAHLLIADGGDDSRPLFSPDGSKLAFESNATGNGDVYVLDLPTGKLQRATWADSAESLDAWSHDGRWLYFSSSRDNVGGMQGIFRVRVDGGTPMPVSVEAYRNEQHAAPSADASQLALIGSGMGDFQWWRHGSSHIDSGAVWVLKDDGSHTYKRVTPDNARAEWPMWSADGESIFYVSDRSLGAPSKSTAAMPENIWRTTLDGDQQALTHFSDGRLVWPTISANGATIAFERDFGVWTLDTASGQSKPVPISLAGAVRGPGISHESLNKEFTNATASPDGKKVAFIAHGEIFAADAEKGGDADRVTHTQGAEYGIAWAPDSRRIVYSSVRSNGAHLYLYDFASGKERALTSGDGEDSGAVFSPDGKSIAFLRDGHLLDMLDVSTATVRTLNDSRIDFHRPLSFDRSLAWSPDGRWIAYLAFGARMYRNAYAVSVADGHSVGLSFLANTGADDVNWSSDGKSLLFGTSQRTELGEVARVDLLPRTPVFREDQFHDLFKEAKPPSTPQHKEQDTSDTDAKAKDKDKESDSKKEKPDASEPATKPGKNEPVRIEPVGIRERLDVLPIGLDVQLARLSPDGKTLVVVAEVAGKTNLYAWSMDRLEKKPPVARQLTTTPGEKGSLSFSADSKHLFYLDDGRIFALEMKEGATSKPLEISADLDIDFDSEKAVVFEQAWSWLRANFHDAAMNGIDWNAMHALYAPRVAAAATPGALYRLLNLLVGELNASHSGVRGTRQNEQVTGHVGVQFDRAEYERSGNLRISAILPLSPAAVSGKVHVGDELLAVDGQAISAQYNVDRAMANTIGRKTVLRIKTAAGATTDVEVLPVSAGSEGELAYSAWVERSRAYVDRVSHGRLGFAHLRDMSFGSLQRFYKDLDAENSMREGVVIDARNNFGGFVNAYALDVLSRKPYLHMTFRGFDKAESARGILGQRALERPTVLVTNRVTLSDGEDFSEGYRALGLGKIVGEPTAGWIIYTSNEKMIDGSSVRMPFITISDRNNQPMEMHPRSVDVPVSRPLGEGYRNQDSDLDAAVSTLLQQLGGAQ